jgi:hypothetical protein
MAKRCNIGVRLRQTDLVIDIDPRNGGNESFEQLQRDIDVRLDSAPTVRTGIGGRHVFGPGRGGKRIRNFLAAVDLAGPLYPSKL